MNVVSLLEFRFRETIAILRYVLKLSLQGEVSGLALCFRRDGRDEYAFTGDFKTDSSEAVKATTRIAWKMNQAMDATESTY